MRYERARIASELHDIVAHAISVMVVQATAGQRLAPHDPEATAETFEAIAGAARQAEHEMALLVELLADERAAGADADIALVEDLVARASGSGLDVTLALEGDRGGMPPETARLAYRVVQEGLTNALRYAAGAPVRSAWRARPPRCGWRSPNGPVQGEPSLAGVGTGNGLRGLRERVEAAGGTLEAGPEGGGWRLGVRLPRIPGRPLPAPQATGRNAQVEHPVRVLPRPLQLERPRRRPVGEQPRPLASGEGEDEQVQAVDEPVGQHRAHQGAAAGHEHVAVRLVAQRGRWRPGRTGRGRWSCARWGRSASTTRRAWACR